jgi:hypothetical protein
LINQFSPQYMKATTKLDKTEVVIAAIIEQVRIESTGGGGFVKKDLYSGRWYEIGDEKARDQVGHAMRKAAELFSKEHSACSSSKKIRSKAVQSIKKTKKKKKELQKKRGVVSSSEKLEQKETGSDHRGGEARSARELSAVEHGGKQFSYLPCLGKKDIPMTQFPFPIEISSAPISYDLSRALPASLLPASFPALYSYGMNGSSSAYGGRASRLPTRFADSSVRSGDFVFGAGSDVALRTLLGWRRPLLEPSLRGGATF